MIQQEKIHIKQSKTGVTFFIFSDAYYNNTPVQTSEENFGPYPSYVLFDNQNVIESLFYFNGDSIWSRNGNNNYMPLSEVTGNNFITGYTLATTISSNLTDTQINEKINKVYNRINAEMAPSACTNYVFAERRLIDDLFVDVKIERSYNSLDTLKIYNNLVGSFPTQESKTGVVFGKLTAIQKIKNKNGQNVRIPLVNVPIGIFNPSDEFPQIFSTDDNGDRLTLNLKETSDINEYFNDYSYEIDYNTFLRSGDSFSGVPAQYKYITKTDENGEFILYDIPVGQQTVVLEIDLFKQGLTKDEIALNFFPFPGVEDANIDAIPSFVYKQFPIEVVPSWGLGQTGYTSLDASINLDLRKWTTFYVSPMSYAGFKLGSTELFNFASPLSVDVRDMSREGFPTTNIPIVEIHDIVDKDPNQALYWNNEFSQLKSSAKFFTHGFKAFKVRANIYDPSGFRTDNNGVPILSPYSRGVWLSAYQFKMYYNNPKDIFRATGFQRDYGFSQNGWIGRDNFNLNRNIIQDTKNTSTPPNYEFPYNKPWDHTFPEKYSIPKRPIQLNFNRSDNSTRLTNSSGKAYLEQPQYLDGDMVGTSVTGITNETVGGYGIQKSFDSNYWLTNRFSQEVTSTLVYKYESRVAWNEKYSNGYQPSNPSFAIQPNISQVLNGEKYQRVECGYGYWLRPEGWPQVAVESFGDTIFTEAIKPGDTLSSNNGPGVLNIGQSNGNIIVGGENIIEDVYNIDQQDLTIAFDNDSILKEGSLDIYRIVNSNTLIAPGAPVVPTSVTLNFGPIYVQRSPVTFNTTEIRTAYDNDTSNSSDRYFSVRGGSGHADNTYNQLLVYIRNNGIIPVEIPNVTNLSPGESIEVDAVAISIENLVLTLPGNAAFDFTESKYTEARYSIEFRNVRLGEYGGGPFGNQDFSIPYTYPILGPSGSADIVLGASTNSPNYYLIHKWTNVKTHYDKNNESCQTGGGYSGSLEKWKNDVRVYGVMFPVVRNGDIDSLYGVGGSDNGSLKFEPSQITITCSGGISFNNNLYSIPIECQYLTD